MASTATPSPSTSSSSSSSKSRSSKSSSGKSKSSKSSSSKKSSSSSGKKKSSSRHAGRAGTNRARIQDLYSFGKELGRGAFSIVRLATRKSDGIDFAVKVIDKKNVQQDLDRLQTEMDILKKVKHANIIALEDLFETADHFYIVTELVTGGELFDKIVEKGNYGEADAAVLVSKILSAIEYLHHLGIVHRDLKPENLLLKDHTDISEVKLADFGLSKIVGQTGFTMMQTACGTPGYVAPEVLKACGYGPEVDLWSIGVITYILLCGFPPFYHDDLPVLFDQIMEAEYDFPAEYWDPISEEAKDFIRKLLVVNPAERLTASAALTHPWIVNAPKVNKPLSRLGSKLGEYVSTKKANSKVMEGRLEF